MAGSKQCRGRWVPDRKVMGEKRTERALDRDTVSLALRAGLQQGVFGVGEKKLMGRGWRAGGGFFMIEARCGELDWRLVWIAHFSGDLW